MTNVENPKAGGGARPYDFHRPQRLIGEARDRFGESQARLADAIGAALTDELNREVAVAFREAAEEPARTVLDEAADPAWAIRTAGGVEGILCVVEGMLAQAFVEMLLGGPGAPRPVDHPPTVIEKALLEKPALRIARSLPAGGAAAEGAEASVLYLDGEEREARAGLGGAAGVFDIALGEESGAFRLFYGYDELTSLFGLKLGAARDGGGSAEKMTRDHVGGVRIGVRARLLPTPVRIGDITSLRVGDVLSLDRPLTDPVELQIGGRTAYLGHPGRVDDRVGVRIAREA